MNLVSRLGHGVDLLGELKFSSESFDGWPDEIEDVRLHFEEPGMDLERNLTEGESLGLLPGTFQAAFPASSIFLLICRSCSLSRPLSTGFQVDWRGG